MGAGFRVHGNDVCTGFRKGRHEDIDGRDHKMDIEGLAAVRPQGLHHAGPDGQVGDEVAVHDVNMDIIGAGFVDRAHFFAQSGEVRRQDRGRYTGALLHGH